MTKEPTSDLRRRLMKAHVVVSEAAEGVAQLQDRIRVLEADHARAKELLAEHEWCGAHGEGCQYCPSYYPQQHDAECQFAIFLGLPRDE